MSDAMREALALAIERADRERPPEGYANGFEHPEISDWGLYLADAVLVALSAPDGWRPAKDELMYVCKNCAEHNPEACGHYDRNELRVLPGGEWTCETCFEDGDLFRDMNWSDLPIPPEAFLPAPPKQG